MHYRRINTHGPLETNWPLVNFPPPFLSAGMDSLDHLTLNSNKLRHLGAEFFMGLDALTTLYIDHNQIRTINVDAFKGLESK